MGPLLKGVAKVTAAVVKQLEGRAEPDQVVTEADVQEPQKLSRLLTSILKDVAALKRRAYPRRIDFHDVAFTSANTVPLRHGFGGQVNWWVVRWQSTGTALVDSGGDNLSIKSPMLVEAKATDANTLHLTSSVGGTAVVRVEESG